MDIHYIAASLSALLTVVAVVPYIWDMLRGTTRPNIVSWGLWLLVQSIFAVGQFAEGASLSIVLPIVEVFTVGLVVILGLVGYGYKKYGPLDILCLLLALGAIALWQITNDPMVALWMSVAADLVAAVPTLVKAYKDPESETISTYFLVVLSAIAAGFSSTIINIPNLLWPIYIFSVNGAVVVLVFLGKKVRR